MRIRGVKFEDKGIKGVKVVETIDEPWTEEGALRAFPLKVSYDKEHLQYWSAAQYKVLSVRDNGTPVYYPRSNDGVEHMHAAVLDMDDADPGTLDLVIEHLEGRGLAYLIYTSWGHGNPEAKHKSGKVGPFDKFRVVLPYSRPVSKVEHGSVVMGLMDHEVPSFEHYNREVIGLFYEKNGREFAVRPRGWDSVCTRPSQGYFTPTLPFGREDKMVLEIRAGRPIDPDEVLARPTTPRVEWRRSKPLQAPSALALSLLDRFSHALYRAGVSALSEPRFGGWRRTTCPSCTSSSASLTVRANGDGLDMKCWGHCTREEILTAAGFNEEAARAEPTTTRLLLEEQLERQLPPEKLTPIDEVGQALTDAILAAVRAQEPTIIRSPPGSGKAQPHSEPVLLDRGWVPMGEVIVGDRVYGSDGKLHDVVAVHPQGVRPVFRVTFSDGSWTRCDADHLWTFESRGGFRKTQTTTDWGQEKLHDVGAKQTSARFFCPLVSPVEREETTLPLDPYTLGAFLGDGSFRSRGDALFSSADDEILGFLVLPPGYKATQTRERTSKAAEYRITRPGLRTGGTNKNAFSECFRALGLWGHKAQTKFVPRVYLQASANQRLAILQGLMDTDGTCRKTSQGEFVSTSQQLANDVCELAESLGGACYVTQRKCGAWSVSIKLPKELCPFRLTRKKEQWYNGGHKRRRFRSVLKIEPDGEELCSCLTTSAPDHLYVTRRYILTHNSFSAAQAITTLAKDGERVVYATMEHEVAHSTRKYLPQDVRSVHTHSPLIQVGDTPACQRAAELHETVFEYGQSLLGKICPRCKFKDSCEARAAAAKRQEELPYAQVVFVSHAGIGQLFGLDREGLPKNLGMKLIVDEMPSTYESVEVSGHELAVLAKGDALSSADPELAKGVQEVARAVLERREPGKVRWGDHGPFVGPAAAIVEDAGRMRLREGVTPREEEKGALKAADALIRLWCARQADLQVSGWDSPAEGLSSMVPDQCHTALVERNGVLLSATPFSAALPGFSTVTIDVADGAPVRRVMILRAGRGSAALAKVQLNEDSGKFERGGASIRWSIVEAALERARGYGRRILFVSFKSIVDELRKRDDLPGFEWGHFGALRGRNDWQQGAEREVDCVYLLGSPRFALQPTIAALGLFGEAADHAWVECAAGELAQAEGRLRIPRRTKPCTVVVEGDVAPLGWSAENLSELNEADEIETPSGLLELALRYQSPEDIHPEARVWLESGAPESAREALRAAAYPTLDEFLLWTSRASPGRVERLKVNLNWENDECD